MILLGLWLGALGVADAVAGLSGRPGHGPRPVLAVILAVILVAAAAFGLGYNVGPVFILSSVVAVTTGGWLWVRIGSTPVRAGLGLAGFAVTTSALLLVAPLWPASSVVSVVRWLRDSPFKLIERMTVDEAVLLLGIMVWLFATANALVRLVLLSVGSDPREGETQLKGGRIIGPMERWIIFSFAMANSLPAAALVVAAKSLVRFPEIGRDPSRVHEVTEYFLVGSMSSWLLALLPSLLFQ